MSDSTPEKTPARSPTKRVSEMKHPELGGTGAWWVLSAVIHTLILLVLLWFTPLRTIILQPGKDTEFQTTANADRIEEVVAEIRDHRAAEIAFEVEELLDIAETLEDIREAKLDDYDQFTDELAKDAPSKALAAQDEALKAQQEALEEMGKAQQASKQADGAQAEVEKAPPDNAAGVMAKAKKAQGDAQTAHKKARNAQIRADEAQAQAAQLLAMLDHTMKGPREAQQQAIAAQAAAAGAEAEAEKVQEGAQAYQDQAVARQANVPRYTKRVADLTPPVQQLEGQAKKADTAAAGAKQQAAEARKAYDDAKAQATRAERAVGKAKAPEAKKQAQAGADAARKERDRLKGLADRAQAQTRQRENQARDARNRLGQARRTLEGAKKQRENVIAETRKSQASARGFQKTAAGATGKAQEAQKRAIEAQKKARDAVGKAMKSAAPIAAANRADGDTRADRKRPNLFDRDVAELYDLAVGTERKSTEAYKDVRAAELAIIRRIPLADARGQTDVAKPLRPELDRKLLTQPVRDIATAGKHKREVETAIREVRSMVTLGRRMLDMAQGSQADGAAAVSLDWYRAKAAQQEELTRAAMEDAGAVAKDVSELMKAAAAGGAENGADGAHTAGQAGRGQGGEGAAGNPGAGAGPPGRLARKAPGGGGWSGPPVVERDLKAIPGRKVLSGGLPAKWMYVDSWYVIGPFPNPKRINRDKKFPPESVVDLDAKYVAKNGKVVRWEFMKTTEPLVLPPHPEEYAIYYAYSELWFEKAMDLWIAVGSDDKSSLWIEDQPVWVSANHLKSWQVAEGMRKVHFKKGLNRILYRIENGWHFVGWSLVIHTNSPRASK